MVLDQLHWHIDPDASYDSSTSSTIGDSETKGVWALTPHGLERGLRGERLLHSLSLIHI